MLIPKPSHRSHQKSTPAKLVVGLLRGAGVLGGIGLVFLLFLWALLTPLSWEESRNNGELLTSALSLAEPIYEIQLNEDDHAMLVRTRGNVLLRDSRSGDFIRVFPSLDWYVSRRVAWLPGSHRLLVGCRDGRLLIVDSRSSNVVFSAKVHEQDMRSIAITADGTIAATASEDRICLWDLGQQRVIAQIPARGFVPHVLQFSPDQSRLLVGCGDGSLKIHRTSDLQLERCLKPHSSTIVRALFIENGQKIISGSIYGEVFLHEVATGRICWNPSPCRIQVLDMAISPDERLVGFTDWSKAIHVYSLETLEKIGTLEGHSQAVCSLRFSEQEPWLYSSGYDGTIRIWDTQSFTELACFQGTLPSDESM